MADQVKAKYFFIQYPLLHIGSFYVEFERELKYIEHNKKKQNQEKQKKPKGI